MSRWAAGLTMRIGQLLAGSSSEQRGGGTASHRAISAMAFGTAEHDARIARRPETWRDDLRVLIYGDSDARTFECLVEPFA